MTNKDMPPKTKEETEEAIKALEERIEKEMREVEEDEATLNNILNTENSISNSSPEEKNPYTESNKTTNELIDSRANEYSKKSDSTIEEIKANTEKAFEKIDAEKNNKIVGEKLKSLGLTEEDFGEIPKWGELSYGEKLLVIEQASQDTLSTVKETGEKRFQNKNKINFTGNVNEWELGSVTKKIWHKIGKSYYVNEEKKNAVNDLKSGKLKPEKEILSQLVERTADMHLNIIVGNDGKPSVAFASLDKNTSPESTELLNKYNKIANEFASMPDAWKNINATKNTDKLFNEKNHEKYANLKKEYEDARDLVLESKIEQYKKSGMEEGQAEKVAMNDMKDSDYTIAILQLTNTNPDALGELKKIENTSSFKALFNNENIWRAGYMAGGFATRTATKATLGLLAAPLVSGVVGGLRARRKAGQKINEAFLEGRKEETFLERKNRESNNEQKDSSKLKDIVGTVIPGMTKVNAKEVAGFIDADSQVQRLEKLMEKLENSTDTEERKNILSALNARIDYIESKHEQGLINYGTKNSITLGYKLLKNLSEAEVMATTHALGPMGMEAMLNPKIIEASDPDFFKNITVESRPMDEHRATLLQKIIDSNVVKMRSEQDDFINKETVKGAITGAGFSVLGMKIREWVSPDGYNLLGSNEAVQNDTDLQKTGLTSTYVAPIQGMSGTSELPNTGGTLINPETGKFFSAPENTSALGGANTVFHDVKIEATADHGQGAISTIRELQAKLEAEYGKTFDTAPASVRHILNTPEARLAEEYGLYKPDQVNESAMMMSGDKLVVDKNGDLILERMDGSKITLENGLAENASGTYEGKMFDSDHTGIKNSTTINGGGLSPENSGGNIPTTEIRGLEELGGGDGSDFTKLENPIGPTNQIRGLEELGGVGNNAGGNIQADANMPKIDTVNNNLGQAPAKSDIGEVLRTDNPDYVAEYAKHPPILTPTNGAYTWDVEQGKYVHVGGDSSTMDKQYPTRGNGGGTNTGRGRAINTNEAPKIPKYSSLSEHFEDARSVERNMGRRNVIIDLPKNETINGIKNRDWSMAADQMFANKNKVFSLTNQYESNEYEFEDHMQRLLGHAKQEIRYNPTTDKNQPIIIMDYFREQKEWKNVVSKIPAKYFFDFKGAEEIRLTDGSVLPKESLKDLGILKENGEYEFRNIEELRRISNTYEKYIPKEEKILHNEAPIGNETLETYIARMSRVVHTTNDGTLYTHEYVGPKNPIASGSTTNTSANAVIPDPIFQKVFPDNEMIQGISRGEYDREVAKILENEWKVVPNESHKKADIWMWESFGRIDGSSGVPPLENNSWLKNAMDNRVPAQSLMNAKTDTPGYIEIGSKLIELKNKIKAQTGLDINPTPDESIILYVRRLMEKI